MKRGGENRMGKENKALLKDTEGVQENRNIRSVCVCSVAKSYPILVTPPWTTAHQASLSMGFARKDTGVGCHFLLQGIFPTQGSNLHLLHCRQIIYCWATREALLSLRFQLKYHFLRQAYSTTILTKYFPLLLSSQCNHFSFKAIITICKYTKNVLITIKYPNYVFQMN